MDVLEACKQRRSIRRYQEKQVPLEQLETIVEAGTYAPNAGGGQRSMLVVVRNPQLVEKLGRLNAAGLHREALVGTYVSHEHPSIIDDPTIKSGFYGAPSLCVIFSQANFAYGVADAFCCAENMVLTATELGVSSCIVARGEETFDNDFGQGLMREWEVPEGYVARCFVLLGYCDGSQPKAKPRKPGRVRIIE